MGRDRGLRCGVCLLPCAMQVVAFECVLHGHAAAACVDSVVRHLRVDEWTAVVVRGEQEAHVRVAAGRASWSQWSQLFASSVSFVFVVCLSRVLCSAVLSALGALALAVSSELSLWRTRAAISLFRGKHTSAAHPHSQAQAQQAHTENYAHAPRTLQLADRAACSAANAASRTPQARSARAQTGHSGAAEVKHRRGTSRPPAPNHSCSFASSLVGPVLRTSAPLQRARLTLQTRAYRFDAGRRRTQGKEGQSKEIGHHRPRSHPLSVSIRIDAVPASSLPCRWRCTPHHEQSTRREALAQRGRRCKAQQQQRKQQWRETAAAAARCGPAHSNRQRITASRSHSGARNKAGAAQSNPSTQRANLTHDRCGVPAANSHLRHGRPQ